MKLGSIQQQGQYIMEHLNSMPKWRPFPL
jgi:hypothetical protein